MKLRLLIYFAAAITMYGQNIVQFTWPSSLSPASVPTSCLVNPQTFSQQITDQWKMLCSGGGPPRNMGFISGGGTGACPTIFGGDLAPCVTPNNAYAPTFTQKAILNQATQQWSIFEQIGNASLQWVGIGNNPPFGWYKCAPPSSTQGPVTIAANPTLCECNPSAQACLIGKLSPIVIDTTGEGFFLTDAAHGVEFRKAADSQLQQMSWTDPAHYNAWLVRPNADGSVTSLAANMFGNLSPQPASDTPNGYAALAYWASQTSCGKISKLDAKSCPAVWSQLKLWHDANQDGIAQPGELSTLDAAGVDGISLNPHEADWTDQYGNQFRFESSIDDSAGPHDKRTYDVFLVF